MAKKQSKKRYCVHGHDTFLTKRKKNGTCKACETERGRTENMTEEQILRKRTKDLAHWNNIMSNPLIKMKVLTKRRIRKNERKLNGDRL